MGRFVLGLGLALLIGGCDGGGDPVDAAPAPVAPDAAGDAMHDASPDAMPDTSAADATADIAPDAMSDAMPGALQDAATDAMPAIIADAIADAAPDAAPADAAPPDPEAVAYCDCMLLTCHDLYHLLWTDDEGVARQRCFEVAGRLPRAPGAVEGDSLHCRRHWCDEAFDLDDLDLCDRAGGLSVCR